MPHVQLESETIYYDQHDHHTGPQLVLIHGSGGDHLHWPAKLRQLNGAAVIALDLPGHGRSSGRGCNSVDADVKTVEAFIRKLALRLTHKK